MSFPINKHKISEQFSLGGKTDFNSYSHFIEEKSREKDWYKHSGDKEWWFQYPSHDFHFLAQFKVELKAILSDTLSEEENGGEGLAQTVWPSPMRQPQWGTSTITTIIAVLFITYTSLHARYGFKKMHLKWFLFLSQGAAGRDGGRLWMNFMEIGFLIGSWYKGGSPGVIWGCIFCFQT